MHRLEGYSLFCIFCIFSHYFLYFPTLFLGYIFTKLNTDQKFVEEHGVIECEFHNALDDLLDYLDDMARKIQKGTIIIGVGRIFIHSSRSGYIGGHDP
jgi:hypothetical protein